MPVFIIADIESLLSLYATTIIRRASAGDDSKIRRNLRVPKIRRQMWIRLTALCDVWALQARAAERARPSHACAIRQAFPDAYQTALFLLWPDSRARRQR